MRFPHEDNLPGCTMSVVSVSSLEAQALWYTLDYAYDSYGFKRGVE